MRQIVYATGSAVACEPYTHRMVGHVLRTAANRNYSIRLLVPDAPETLDATLLMQMIRSGKAGSVQVSIEPSQSILPPAAPGSVLLFAGSLDYWRIAMRSSRTIRQYKKVFWVQGIESDESFMKHNSILRRLAVSIIESTAMMASSVIICPSDAMTATLLSRYPFLQRKTFVTIPNLADLRTVPERDPLLWGFKESPRLVLGYSGGLSRWQCFAEMCRVVAEVQNQIPDAWFFVLTRHEDEAEDLLRRYGVKRYRIRSTTTDQVVNYVSSFDMGFLLRRDHIVNRVACPMKWLEYWQCGVPLVTTHAVKIISEARGSEFNCTVDLHNVKSAAKRIVEYTALSNTARSRIRSELTRCVEDNWTWPIGLRSVEDFFDALEIRNIRYQRLLWKERCVPCPGYGPQEMSSLKLQTFA